MLRSVTNVVVGLVNEVGSMCQSARRPSRNRRSARSLSHADRRFQDLRRMNRSERCLDYRSRPFAGSATGITERRPGHAEEADNDHLEKTAPGRSPGPRDKCLQAKTADCR